MVGSLDETRSHRCFAYDWSYLSKEESGGLFREGPEIRKMTVPFTTSMVKPDSGVKHLRKMPDWNERIWER